MYLEQIPMEDLPAARLAGELLHCGGSPAVERFCDAVKESLQRPVF